MVSEMKKLFALVLALAMALAIAIPTMAAGWDPIKVDEDPATAISFKLYGLETKENTAVLGSLYQELTATYPLVKGTPVHFMVVVSIPAEADLSAANVKLLAARGLKVKVSTDYIQIDKVSTYITKLSDGSEAGTTKNVVVDAKSWSTTLDTASEGFEYKFEFVGQGTTGGKDATVKASVGYYNVWEGDTFVAYNAKGTKSFTVTANGVDAATEGTFSIFDGKNTVVFPVKDGYVNDDAGSAIKLTVANGGKGDGTYYVTRSTASNGGYIFRVDDTEAWGVSDTTGRYEAIKAVFDNFLALLGFQYDGSNAMTKAHFVKYFGTIDEVVETLVYPAGYVTVTNPTVEPPQTGDATTVVGFVMIALALVAAAVVTVKKVRA